MNQSKSPKELSALILAGGKSLRMGRDKALLSIRGTTLIEHLISQIDDLFEEILVCAASREKYGHLNLRIIADEAPIGGPLVGILSGLRAARTEACFVLSCDIPYVDRQFLLRIISRASQADLVIPRYDNGNFEPLLGIYSKRAIPVIERQITSGRMKIADIYPECRTEYVRMDDETWYRNLNTAEEYADYMERG